MGTRSTFLNTSNVNERLFSLPIHPLITKEMVDYISCALLTSLQEIDERL
jgi:hypothetical protein